MIVESILGGAALVGYFASRKKREVTAPAVPECNSGKAVSQAVGSTVSGAAAGAPAGGPVGAGIGAGLGLALAATSDLTGPCGNQWIRHAEGQIKLLGQNACQKADSVLAVLKSHGIAKPMGYDTLSCDQKLALVVSLASPLGIFVAGVSELAGTAAAAVNTTVNNVESAVSGAQDAAKSAAKKLGF